MYQRILLSATVCAFFCCALLIFLLARTEQRCIEYAAELAAVRDEYLSYRMVQRRILDQQEIADEDEKKKEELISPTFVNRDREYLRKQALIHARAYDLEDSVRRLYDDRPSHPKPTHVRSSSGKRRIYAPRSQQRSVRMPPAERLFIWPIDQNKFWISSPYGPRKRPDGSFEFHGGIDMAALRGTPIYSAKAGIVEQAGWRRGYGNTILVRHEGGMKTRYAHLASIVVYPGDRVDRSTMIGRVGDTGLVRSKGKDASHLHYEVYVHGKRVNPFHYTA
jgi:murein DD-endopeptidase MepM/ murein hydrolase activator NlpD